jgi:WD40 repeat protein
MLVLEGHEGAVSALAYSPDGRRLASGGADGLVKLWDPQAGSELLACRSSPIAPVTSLAFSPDGKVLAAGRVVKVAELWETSSGERLRQHVLREPDSCYGGPVLVAFSSDGRRLATACRLHVVEWEGLTDRRLREVTPPASYTPRLMRSVAYSSAGVLAAGDRNIITLWPTAHARDARTINWPEGDVLGLTFSPSGEVLAVARGRDVAFWSFHDEKNHYRRLRVLRHGETVRAIAFTPDGQALLTGGDDWTVRVWDVATGQERNSFNWRIGPVVALAVSPDAMTVAVAGRGRSGILIWDLE